MLLTICPQELIHFLERELGQPIMILEGLDYRAKSRIMPEFGIGKASKAVALLEPLRIGVKNVELAT